MENIDILELIPQRQPMVMVGKLEACDEKITISTFSIENDNVFLQNKVFLEAGLIENIAQTAAARMGFLSRSQGGEPRVGYIGGIKNLNIYFLPEIHSTLTTHVEVVNEVMGFTIINGTVFVNGEKAAECEMRIFLIE